MSHYRDITNARTLSRCRTILPYCRTHTRTTRHSTDTQSQESKRKIGRDRLPWNLVAQLTAFALTAC